MKGVHLLIMDGFVKNGRRIDLTIRDIQDRTNTSNQNSNMLLKELMKKDWIKIADDRVNPRYHKMTKLGFKVWKGIRNVQSKPVIVIK